MISQKLFKERCLSERKNFVLRLSTPQEIQKNLLLNLLDNNQDTKLGIFYNFKSINSINSFKENIPIQTYEMILPWIEKEIINNGGVITNDKVIKWLRTSGSMGNPKKIPLTDKWLNDSRTPALFSMWGNYLFYHPEIISHRFSILDMSTTRDSPTEFINDLPWQGISNRASVYNDKDWQTPWYDEPWFSSLAPNSYDEKMYYRIRYFIDQDLKGVVVINPSSVVAIHYHLIKNLSRLIGDILNGTVNGVRKFKPNRELAEKLSSLKVEKIILQDIWPNLTMVGCWTSASSFIYLKEIKRLLPKVQILPYMNCGSEGIVAIPIDEMEMSCPLAIGHGFYEFISADKDLSSIVGKNVVDTITDFSDLKIGKEYHLIMTQGNGFYRYASGDIYKIVGFYKKTPRLEFSRRDGVCHSFTGEKLTENQFIEAIESTSKCLNIEMGLYMIFPIWSEIPYYRILIEVDKKMSIHSDRIAKMIDHNLMQINEEYESKRKSSRLGNVTLEIINNGAINAVFDKKKDKGNSTQIKYKLFSNELDLMNEIVSFNNNINNEY